VFSLIRGSGFQTKACQNSRDETSRKEEVIVVVIQGVYLIIKDLESG
jgi:hypothetical protein